MKRQFFHSALSLFTLCVMTLTSTGYTAVMGYCTMTKEATCCCEEASEAHGVPLPGVAITEPVVSCFTQWIAGGLNEITATTQSDALAHPTAVEAIIADPSPLSHPGIEQVFLSSAEDDASPPGVPIYIRVNSFLI